MSESRFSDYFGQQCYELTNRLDVENDLLLFVNNTCLVCDLGRRSYGQVRVLQKALVQERHHGQLARDVFLIVEHEPVFTFGRQGSRDHLLVCEPFLTGQDICVCSSERGGEITFHGPGQLVAYLIMDLRKAKLSVVSFVSRLEQAMIQTARDFQIQAQTNSQNRGVWVYGRKLGSLGVAVRHGITFHGLALNVDMDLTPFSYINPCGLDRVTMSTLALETGQKVHFKHARDRLICHLLDLFEIPPKTY